MSSPEHHYDFETAGASLSVPMQASALRKGGFVNIKGHPCRITDMSISKTGKHGHAKVKLEGKDIFDNKKYEDVTPSTHNIDVPRVRRREYQLLMISNDKFLSLFNLDDGETKDDIQLPEGEVGEKIVRLFKGEGKDINVVVQAAMDMEMAIDAKAMQRGN